MKKTKIAILLLTVSIFSPGSFALGSLSEKTTILIQTSDANNRTMVFAASELTKYFNLMTGETYHISTSAEENTQPLLILDINEKLNHDGYRISKTANSIHISGGSPRGCLYGSYMFLHELGCRWPLPGSNYDVIPKLDKIIWTGSAIKSEPAMKFRGLMSTYMKPDSKEIVEFIDYLAKNRFNFLFLYGYDLPSEEILKAMNEALKDRDMGLECGGHIMSKFLSRSLFKEHPEYFREEAGVRVPENNFCPSDLTVPDIIAKNMVSDLDKVKDFDRLEVFHCWPEDLIAGGWCSCEKCKSFSGPDQALMMLNAVEERLPLGSCKIPYLAYHGTINPPQKILPNKNIQLLYAPRERCYRHAMGQCEGNRWYLERLKDQVKWFPDNPEVFEYYQDLILFRCLPMPLYHTIGPDIQAYKKAGIDRLAAHSFDTFSAWAYGSNYYVLGKCLWRGKGDSSDIEEYCQAVYGPSAKAMEKYFDLVFDLCATAVQTCGYKPFTDMRAPDVQPFTRSHIAALAILVTDKHLDNVGNILEKALKIADEPYKTRISQQQILYNAARRETKSIYQTMLAKYEYKKLTDSSSKDDILYVIALAKQALENSGAANEILVSSPEILRGKFVYKDSSAMWNGNDELRSIVIELEQKI